MKIIDLSHPISNNMPVFPGDAPPILTIANTLAEDGFVEKKITLSSHTGTHIDAPAHLLDEGTTLDKYPITKFGGSACVIKLNQLKTPKIHLEDIIVFHCIIETHDYILINTNWDQKWGTDEYYKDFPILDSSASDWLAGFKNLKGIGIDAVSVDAVDSTELYNHKAFFKNDLIIIENLTNLESLPLKEFSITCFPLSFQNAEGSPVRAVAFVSSDS